MGLISDKGQMVQQQSPDAQYHQNPDLEVDDNDVVTNSKIWMLHTRSTQLHKRSIHLTQFQGSVVQQE